MVIIAIGYGAMAENLGVHTEEIGSLISPVSYGFIRYHINCEPIKNQLRLLEEKASKSRVKLDKLAKNDLGKKAKKHFDSYEPKLNNEFSLIREMLKEAPCVLDDNRPEEPIHEGGELDYKETPNSTHIIVKTA